MSKPIHYINIFAASLMCLRTTPCYPELGDKSKYLQRRRKAKYIDYDDGYLNFSMHHHLSFRRKRFLLFPPCVPLMLLISFSLEEMPISYSFVTPSSIVIVPVIKSNCDRLERSSTPCKLGS